jgi:phage terminase large subunit-like protein
MIKGLNEYCENILTNKIPSGLLLKQAVVRFQQDLLNSSTNGWLFDEDSVNKVIEFIGQLKHSIGQYAHKPFILEPWQVFIIANIYGFYLTGTNKRRFKTVYLEMARKNGKTALVAALSLYALCADNEPGAEILLAANSKDQAKIAFNMVRAFAKAYDPEEKQLKRYRSDIVLNDIEHVKSNSSIDINAFIKTLAADANKLDGYNCSLGIVDEYHSAPNSQVRDVIRSSQGMRTNPLLLTITTAGFDKNLPCYELHTLCTEIISGVKQDDSFFGVIYSIDKDDDWQNPNVWQKSNPNLGITVNIDFLKEQVQQAINSPNDQVQVKTKNLNVWCDSITSWILDEYILNATKKVDIAEFKGRNCYIGVDLASIADLTAVSYLFVKDDIYTFKTMYYAPSDALVKKIHADQDKYKDWAAHGYLKVIPGAVTDYDYVLKDMLDISTMCEIRKGYYDRWNAEQWAILGKQRGLRLESFAQNIGNFNSPTKEFERLILSGKVILDDNPINRYCLRNVYLKPDSNGNVRPLKSNEKNKIDGVISMLLSLAAYIQLKSQVRGTAFY